jgi:SAM-dependent methyltransferase
MVGRYRRAMGDEYSGIPTPTHFDEWYAAMAHSSAKDDLVRRHLGLPPEMLSSSLLGWDGVEEITRALRLETGQVLLDLACGRGGYGLEVAQRMGADLVGVDFSPVAVDLATRNAELLGRPARFLRGALEHTGLDEDSVDGVMCVDAIQFSTTPPSAYAEIARVLRPGGRVALTSWQVLDPDDESLPLRLRQVDLQTGLLAAGFEDVEVHQRPEWLAQERALWEEAVTVEPGGDETLAALRGEGESVLPGIDRCLRVIATAAQPA